MTVLSSWGFVAVIILFYIRNKQLFTVDSEATVVIYIFLVLMQAITATVILYRLFGDNDVHPAVYFIFIDLHMHITIIVAAHCGPVWIGNELKGKEEEVDTDSYLEASHGSNLTIK